jgi:hypothetical protein
MMRPCSAALLALVLAAPARAADTSAPVVEHTPVASVVRGSKWVQIFAKITDESKFFPQVFFRYGPGDYQKPLDMKAVKGQKNQFGVNVPIKGDVLEYYLEAYDELGNGPSRSGDPDKPWHVDTSGNPPVAQATPAPAPAPAPKAEGAPIAPPRPLPPPARTADSSAGGTRTWTWVVGGVGVGALAGGLVAGLAFKSADDAYKNRLADDPTQFPSLKSQYDANKTLGRDATILVIAGGVLVATSVVFYFFEPKWNGSDGRRASEDKKLDIGFAAAPVQGGGAAVVAGRF